MASAELLQTGSRAIRAQDTAARQVLLFVNRTAGAGRGAAVVDETIATLMAAGYGAEVLSDFDELQDKAADLYVSGELRAVVSAGGDGTFAAVLNATPQGAPLAVLPMGTENLLARYLDHRRSPADLVRLLEVGVVAPLDAGRAGDRLFSMMLSAGFDAEVVHRVHRNRKGNITHLAYAEPLFRTLGWYRFPKMRASWRTDAGEQAADVRWTFAVNLPRYAMQLPLAPDATGTDGMLDLCLLERGSIRAGMWYLWHMLRRRHHRLSCVTTPHVAQFRLEPIGEEQIPFQIDGDPGGFLPVDIAVVPARMHLLVTPEVAVRLGACSEVQKSAGE